MGDSGFSPEPQPKRRCRRKGWQKGGDGRYIKICPVPGCTAKPQVRLAQHIKEYHKNVTKTERLLLTNNAQVVGQSKTPKAPATGMKTIESLFRVEKQHQPPKAATLPVVTSSTRSHSRFPNSHPEIQNFIKYLEGLDGERKSQKEAKAIAVDVSKFLKFAHPEEPRWLQFLEPQKVKAYLDYPLGGEGPGTRRVTHVPGLSSGGGAWDEASYLCTPVGHQSSLPSTAAL